MGRRTLARVGVACALSVAALSTAPTVRHAEIALAGGEELIAMGATFMPTLLTTILDNIVSVINHHYGTDFTPGTAEVNNLATPESILGPTYLDGEKILLHALQTDAGDAVTVFGVSQSAGIAGMALHEIAADLSKYPSGIRVMALAPPSMPVHGNAAGGFLVPAQQWLMNLLYPNITQPFPADNGPYAVDVYCGMYDPICDDPTGSNFYTFWYSIMNSNAAGNAIHNGYGRLSPAELTYEMDHAQQLDISTDSTHFYLMPDIWNFGTTADPQYDTYIPLLGLNTANHAEYDKMAPLYELYIDAGYDDANHPFMFIHDGAVYTLAGLTGAVSPADAAQFAAAAIQLGQELAQLDPA